MLERLRNWLQEVWNKMINRQTIKEALGAEIAISEPMLRALKQWVLMYEDDTSWMSDVGGDFEYGQSSDFRSLHLPAAIAGEIARLTTIEMDVVIDGEGRGAYLQEQFKKVLEHIREQVEYGVAKGGLIFKPYVKDDEIWINFVQADQFFPINYDANGSITSVIFSDQRVIGKYYYTRLESHTMVDDGCEIINKAFRSENKDDLGREISLDAVEAWADIEPEATIVGIEKPLFAYYRYPSANTIDPSSPLGVSCYSRAVELIKQANALWTDFGWEFESGKRALFIDSLAFGKDADGKPVLPNRRLYRAVETGSVEGDFFEEWSPAFREANLINGLESTLRKIEFAVGLAYGTFSDPNTVEKTATEIASSKQRSYATIVDNQKSLRRALEGLVEAMDVWATLEKLADKGEYTVNFTFDDSVVMDKETQQISDLRMVTSQVMSKVEFRMRNFGEDEETAKKMLELVKQEQPADPFGMGGADGAGGAVDQGF